MDNEKDMVLKNEDTILKNELEDMQETVDESDSTPESTIDVDYCPEGEGKRDVAQPEVGDIITENSEIEDEIGSNISETLGKDAEHADETEDNGADDVDDIKQKLDSLLDYSSKSATEIREMRKLYHNEFSTRLNALQGEVDRYHAIEKGQIYDGLLTSIARLYSENIDLLDVELEDRIHKRIKYMFMDMLEILDSYGVQKQESKEGDKRNTRYCKIVNKIATDNPDMNDTVSRSVNVGFFVDNRPLVKEDVDVYLYDASIEKNITNDENKED